MTAVAWGWLGVGVVIGIVAHMVWDSVLDWLADASGVVADMVRDLLMVAGVGAICYLLYQWAT